MPLQGGILNAFPIGVQVGEGELYLFGTLLSGESEVEAVADGGAVRT